jgi:protein-tyrosine-phosphatase/DNA-binding transcriptional ArsR family regulator
MKRFRQGGPPFVGLAGHPVRWLLLTELAASDRRVRELVAAAGEPQNLISYHLRLLRDAGLVTATRSSYDGRDSYYHLDLDRCAEALAGAGAAVHPALRLAPAPPPRPADLWHRPAVLFVCTGNSARSPLAEALLRHHTRGRAEVCSAGSHPKPALHPHAVRVLRDGYGIDVTGQPTRHLDTVAGRRFDHVISLCDKAREVCPDFGDPARCIHWSIPDPAATGGGYPAFQRAAADIDTRVRHLLPVLADPKHTRR